MPQQQQQHHQNQVPMGNSNTAMPNKYEITPEMFYSDF
jgi:hypothetical protein